ncbi:MAG: VanZ family protein [bacterium]|nr:VanZ family protein [bacterium]
MQIILGDLAVDVWFIALGILIVTLIILWRKKHSLSYLLCFSFFGIYLVYGIGKVFFPIYISGRFVDVMRQQPSLLDINLIPFYFGPFTTLSDALSGLILNIILTVPFGFGLNFIMRVRAKNFIWLAPAVGFGIEITQLIISLILRYPYRVIDINDALMNTLGVWIGYAIFRLFSWIYRWATKHFHIKHEGLSAYIYHVVVHHTRPEKTPEETIFNTTKTQ